MEVPRHSTAPLLQGPAKVSAKDGSGARPRALNMCREHAPTEKGHLQGSCDTITQSTKGCACFGLKDQSPIASKLRKKVSLFANLTGTLRFCWGPEPLGTCLSSLAVPGGH